MIAFIVRFGQSGCFAAAKGRTGTYQMAVLEPADAPTVFNTREEVLRIIARTKRQASNEGRKVSLWVTRISLPLPRSIQRMIDIGNQMSNIMYNFSQRNFSEAERHQFYELYRLWDSQKSTARVLLETGKKAS